MYCIPGVCERCVCAYQKGMSLTLVSNLDHNFLLPSLTFIFSWPPLFVFVSLRFPPPHARFFLREKRKTSWLGRVFVVGRQQKRERKRKKKKGTGGPEQAIWTPSKKRRAPKRTRKGPRETNRQVEGIWGDYILLDLISHPRPDFVPTSDYDDPKTSPSTVNIVTITPRSLPDDLEVVRSFVYFEKLPGSRASAGPT